MDEPPWLRADACGGGGAGAQDGRAAGWGAAETDTMSIVLENVEILGGRIYIDPEHELLVNGYLRGVKIHVVQTSWAGRFIQYCILEDCDVSDCPPGIFDNCLFTTVRDAYLNG